jgi:hypothetical protein
MAVNMARRAAAGDRRVPVGSDEQTDHPGRRSKPVSPGKNRLRLQRAVILGFCMFAALGFVSYAAYAHQWSELSALRHLGKASPSA